MNPQDLALRQYAPIFSYLGTECSMFWSRSQLFLVANSALIGFAAKDITALHQHYDLTEVWLYLALSVAGLLLCGLWLITINLGTKWMSWWSEKLKRLEETAYGDIELWRNRPHRLKIRNLAYCTAALFICLWGGLFLYLLHLIITHQ
jgi:hypothetical protein